MISPSEFANKLVSLGLTTVTGVPDSTFKGLISYFSSQSQFKHIIASNECEAVAIASGYYLAQERPALVYMQNSGFCKTLNPYTSLLSRDVYGIPALLLVGWRGEPGKKDEPQHKMMGRIMLETFKTMELDYTILNEQNWKSTLTAAYEYLISQSKPYIIVIPPDLFEEFKMPEPATSRLKVSMTREAAISLIVETAPPNSVFISTTGKTSRELFEIRKKRGEGHSHDFYTVGSMGCASAIALGAGLAESEKLIYILDGDGAAIMQLGTMATMGHYKNPRIKHIIIDNNAHESTGGQPTVSNTIDFVQMGRACGYPFTASAETGEEISAALRALSNNGELSLLVIKVKKGSRADLGRPTTTPQENKNAFIAGFRI